MGAHIATIVDALGLRELVDGPVQAVATFHPAPDEPSWDATSSLLDLDVRIGASIWLRLTPRFMPVVLHWAEDGQELQRTHYLALDKPISAHLAELSARLVAEDQVGGSTRSVPSLHATTSSPPLPLDQALPAAGVRHDDALWFRLTPTFVPIMVHYRRGDTAESRSVLLPYTRPLGDMRSDLVRQLGLGSAGPLRLHPAVDAPPWPPSTTFADLGMRNGGEAWLTFAPTQRTTPANRLLMMLGSAIIAIILFFVIKAVLPNDPPVVAGVPTVTPAPPTATPVPPTATPAPPTATPLPAQDPDVIAGQAALDAQSWAAATAAFERALVRYPDEPIVREGMAASYVGQGRRLLKDPANPAASLATLRHTFEFSPTHGYAQALERRLVLYLEAENYMQQEDWTPAITSLERLRALQSDFLDAPQRLYDSYMALSTEHKRRNQIDAVKETCQQALTITEVDTREAQQCLQDPFPKLRFVNDGPINNSACLGIRIEGVDATSWRASINGRGQSAPFTPAGEAIICNLPRGGTVIFSIQDGQGEPVPGGSGIPAVTGVQMLATWP